MLSKAKLQFIKSLHYKKVRDAEKLFIAEGEKILYELLQSDFPVHSIYAVQDWVDSNATALKKNIDKVFVVSKLQLVQISLLSNPGSVIAIVHQQQNILDLSDIKNELILALDQINDPGNFGTIVRIADWFGITKIVCSTDCVELYNPKCIQAAMGSVFRVQIFYTELKDFLQDCISQHGNFIYGALLNGEDVYKTKLHSKGVIVIGNESHGISEELLPLISNHITIPSFNSQAESLNAAIATGIILSEFRRRMDVAL